METIKLNLGCGFNKKPDFINVDKSEGCMPDVQLNLVKEIWPWESNSATECIFDFSMEQMGTTPDELKHVLTELYRVCANGATINIRAYHPRHDQFFLNPLCTQRLSIEFFQLLSVSRNLNMIANGMHDDVVGMMWGVNFEVTDCRPLLNARFESELRENRITEDQLRERMNFESNILHVIELQLQAKKS